MTGQEKEERCDLVDSAINQMLQAVLEKDGRQMTDWDLALIATVRDVIEKFVADELSEYWTVEDFYPKE